MRQVVDVGSARRRLALWYVARAAGEVAVILVSVDRDEASARLGPCADPEGPRIAFQSVRRLEVTGARTSVPRHHLQHARHVASRRSPASLRGLAWEARDTGANPAREVIGSLARDGPRADRVPVLSSSPWSVDDYHATVRPRRHPHQVVALRRRGSPTDDHRGANPRPGADDRVWAREYGGCRAPPFRRPRPFRRGQLLRPPTHRPIGRGFWPSTASSLRGDAFAWIGGRETDAGSSWCSSARLRRRATAQRQHAQVGSASPTGPGLGRTAHLRRQREEASLRSMFADHSTALETSRGASPQGRSLSGLRSLMRERNLCSAGPRWSASRDGRHKAHLLPSGRTKYATNGLDFASCVVTLAHAVVAVDVLRAATNSTDARVNDRCALAPLQAGSTSHHRSIDGTRWGGGRGFG